MEEKKNVDLKNVQVSPEEARRKTNKRLEAFLEISQAVSSSSELPPLMQAIVDNAIRVMNLGTGAVYLLENGNLRLAATSPALPEGFPENLRLAHFDDHPHLKKSVNTGRPVVMKDSSKAQLTPEEERVIRLRGLLSNLYVPIQLRKKVLGVLILSSTDKLYSFHQDDISLLQGFAEQAAHAIENVRQFEKARRYAEELEKQVRERVKVEKNLEKLLDEKNVLLSEIHHRVKNNMAIISSMLLLQSEFGDQKKRPEELLQDLQTRIMSMAWVHELVYESKNYAEIESGKLLKRLADYLQNTYKSCDHEITVKVLSDELMLNMNNSVPLTLLVGEVLTNAWKHAFTGRKKGHIDLILEKQEEGFHLVVQDDGVGVEDLDKLDNPNSFGYTIVHGLAKQLRGKLSFSSPQEGGLRVEACFPESC